MRQFLFTTLALGAAVIATTGAVAQERPASIGTSVSTQGSLYVPAAELGVESHDDIGVVSEAPHANYQSRSIVKNANDAKATNATYSARNGTSLYGRDYVYRGVNVDTQLDTRGTTSAEQPNMPTGATPDSNSY